MDEDRRLIHRMRQGDDSAIEEFVRKYYPAILRYCRVHIRDSGYAEDMAQETFAHFFRSLPQYRHYGKAANYLYVIAGNCCRDHCRKHQELPLEALPESAADSLEERMDVRLAMTRLPKEYREAAYLFFVQGLPQARIAKILGIGIPLVKYRIKRARTLLAALLKTEECI